MRFYLIRHGQTEWNIKGKIQGKTDIPLNETGFYQAKLLADAMEHKEAAAIYASPLKRAYETACVMAERMKLPVIPIEELREVDFGLWEGLSWREIQAEYPGDFERWDLNPVEHTPTGGETKEESRSRCKAAMERILSEKEQDVVIVAHGGILVFVADYLLRAQQEKNEVIVKNASITAVDYDRTTGTGRLVFLNDTTHLAELSTEKTNKYC